MAILPREQLVQRRDACVSAPGVILWASTTNLTTCEVHNIDEVTEGEVEIAQMAPPAFFWDVIIGPGTDLAYGEGVYGEGVYDDVGHEEADGIYQVRTGLDPEHYAYPPGSLYWGEGAGEDGVYP